MVSTNFTLGLGHVGHNGLTGQIGRPGKTALAHRQEVPYPWVRQITAYFVFFLVA